jgi:hypothetical protein
MIGGDSFLCAFGQDAVAYYPVADRLLILNQTGKMVWELANEGHEHAAIASLFRATFRHFRGARLARCRAASARARGWWLAG